MEMSDTKSVNSSKLWKVFNATMCVFFSLAAYVNCNDDDWYLWVPIYTVPALLSASAAIKPSLTESLSWRRLINIDFVMCFLYSLYQMFALFTKLSNNSLENPLIHEEGSVDFCINWMVFCGFLFGTKEFNIHRSFNREMGGLLVILAWAGIARYMSSESSRSVESSHMVTVIIFWITTSLASIPLLLWSLCFIDDWHKHYGHCNNMFQK